MKTLRILAAAGAIAVLPCGLHSQTTNTPPAASPQPARPPRPTQEQLQEWRNLPPAERQEKIREWHQKNAGAHPAAAAMADSRRNFMASIGLDDSELQKLPPQERRAKIEAAAAKKRAELKEKEEKGTLTEQEKQLARRLEFMSGPGAAPAARPEQPGIVREEPDGLARQLGLNPDDLRTLSPDERRAKMRAAIEKKTAELKEKKEKGTLTEEDKTLAMRLETMKQRLTENRRPGPHGPPPAKTGTNRINP